MVDKNECHKNCARVIFNCARVILRPQTDARTVICCLLHPAVYQTEHWELPIHHHPSITLKPKTVKLATSRLPSCTECNIIETIFYKIIMRRLIFLICCIATAIASGNGINEEVDEIVPSTSTPTSTSTSTQKLFLGAKQTRRYP